MPESGPPAFFLRPGQPVDLPEMEESFLSAGIDSEAETASMFIKEVVAVFLD